MDFALRDEIRYMCTKTFIVYTAKAPAILSENAHVSRRPLLLFPKSAVIKPKFCEQ